MDNETFSFVACFSNDYDRLNGLLDDTINDGPEGHYPCQSFTGALWSLLAVGFELA